MREFTKYADDSDRDVKSMLNALVDTSTNIEDYRCAFYNLGRSLGTILLSIIDRLHFSSAILACVSEDADWLAKGIMESDGYDDMSLAVYWTSRLHLASGEDVAPIIRSFEDIHTEHCDDIIIVKSIISSACVVKTQIMRLISKFNPKNIYIVAPVMYIDSQKSLEDEFPIDVRSKFKYVTFAIDNEKNNQNEIVPGIGGMVYDRLGLGGIEHKNSYTPEIVKKRVMGQLLKV